MTRSSAAKRKRLLVIFSILAAITLVVVGAYIYVYKKCHSDKEKYRTEGITAMKNGSYETALTDFHKSLAEQQWFSEDMDLDTKMYMGACYLRLERFEEAAEMYKSLSRETSKVIDQNVVSSMLETAEANMLVISVSNGKTTAPSKETVERLKQQAAENSRMYIYLASAYNRREEYDLAREALENYRKEQPMNSYVAYELSAAYLRDGDISAAESMIAEGLRTADGVYNDLLQYNRVIVLEKQGKYEEAYQLIDELQKQHPGNEDMQREYTFLYSRVFPDDNPVNPFNDALSDEEWAAIREQLNN